MERRPNKINATLVMLLLSCVRSCLSSSGVVASFSSTTAASFQCSTKQIIHRQLIKAAVAVGDTTEDYRIQPTTNNNNNDNDTLTYQICEAKYSDLPQAAELTTTGFYPELQNNPFMRPIRYLLELDRLQNNFPYDEDGRHYYLVAILSSNTNTTFDSGSVLDDRKIIGFCDIDGRIPMKNKEKKNIDGLLSSFLPSLLSPFAITNVNRPQPYFSDLSIHSQYRQRGVASSLMKEAERRASCMGFDELYLGVRSTNDVALQMYSRYGYEFITPQGDMVAFLNVQKGVRLLRRSLLDSDD